MKDDVVLVVPKTYTEKSKKEGGDPVNREGKDELRKILQYALNPSNRLLLRYVHCRNVQWSELASVTDVNDDGEVDANDHPAWTPMAEIIVGEPAIPGRDDCPNPVRPGRVFRRNCVLKRV